MFENITKIYEKKSIKVFEKVVTKLYHKSVIKTLDKKLHVFTIKKNYRNISENYKGKVTGI